MPYLGLSWRYLDDLFHGINRPVPGGPGADHSARSVAAGAVRAATVAGARVSRFPARSRTAAPSTRTAIGIAVTGTTPSDPAKACQAQRPPAMPGGPPSTTATFAVEV